VFGKFKEFKSLVENQSKRRLSVSSLMEEVNILVNAFQLFLMSEGISWQRIVPYTPQQNGVAERKNRVIMEMACCMLHSKKMKLSFWGEVIVCVAHIINRTPTHVVHRYDSL
jgi:hypothetical protein